MLSKINNLCDLYRDEFGRLDRQGLHAESLQSNLYRPNNDEKLKILKMKNLKFMREKERWRAYDRNGNPVTLPECKRKSFHDITEDEFRHEYLERNQPLIITDAFDHWKALKNWNKEYFLDHQEYFEEYLIRVMSGLQSKKNYPFFFSYFPSLLCKRNEYFGALVQVRREWHI